MNSLPENVEKHWPAITKCFFSSGNQVSGYMRYGYLWKLEMDRRKVKALIALGSGGECDTFEIRDGLDEGELVVLLHKQ